VAGYCAPHADVTNKREWTTRCSNPKILGIILNKIIRSDLKNTIRGLPSQKIWIKAYMNHISCNNNIITMAQQPYMGSGLLLPPLFEVTKSCPFVPVGDWPTGRATILSILMCPPEPSGRQSGDLGEKCILLTKHLDSYP
jgi:hypothetical protein